MLSFREMIRTNVNIYVKIQRLDNTTVYDNINVTSILSFNQVADQILLPQNWPTREYSSFLRLIRLCRTSLACHESFPPVCLILITLLSY
jgi:hypothetical protein